MTTENLETEPLNLIETLPLKLWHNLLKSFNLSEYRHRYWMSFFHHGYMIGIKAINPSERKIPYWIDKLSLMRDISERDKKNKGIEDFFRVKTYTYFSKGKLRKYPLKSLYP